MEAYNYLLKASVTEDIWVERWKLYEKAIELDPEFAEATKILRTYMKDLGLLD